MGRNIAIAAIVVLTLGIAAAFVALSLDQENFIFPSGTRTAEDGIGDQRNSWYSGQLRAMGEQPISSKSTAVYRFTWLRTFHNAICVRVEENNGAPLLVATTLDGQGGYEPGRIAERSEVKLSSAQFARIESLFRKKGFSSLPPNSEIEGKDGAQWIIESTKPDYKVVDYWTPEAGPVREIGIEMLQLAGIVVQDEELY